MSLKSTIQTDIIRAKGVYAQGQGIVGALFSFFNGRCTFFAILFTGVGITLAFMHQLTMEYVALVSAIQALLVAHSTKEDWHQQKQQQQQSTTVVNNVTVDPVTGKTQS